MIPSIGSFCDGCALSVHYSLDCQTCRHVWEEPSFPCELVCPRCGAACDVSADEHEAFAELVRGTARPPAPSRRPSGVWGWAQQAYSSRRRAG